MLVKEVSLRDTVTSACSPLDQINTLQKTLTGLHSFGCSSRSLCGGHTWTDKLIIAFMPFPSWSSDPRPLCRKKNILCLQPLVTKHVTATIFSLNMTDSLNSHWLVATSGNYGPQLDLIQSLTDRFNTLRDREIFPSTLKSTSLGCLHRLHVLSQYSKPFNCYM